MIRSAWKPPFCNSIIFQKLFLSNKEKKAIMILSINSIIFPIFVGHSFLIYNGKKLVNIQVYSYMVGYKFSKYILTKKVI